MILPNILVWPLLTGLCLATHLTRMHDALNEVFKHDRNTTILHTEHFEPGQYMLSTAPNDDDTQPLIPVAKNGVTVVKLFIRTTGDAPAQPDPNAGTDVGIEFWFPDPTSWKGRILNFVDGGWQGSPHVTALNSSGKSSFTSVQYSEWASEFGFVTAISNGGHFTPLSAVGLDPGLDVSYLITADGQYNTEGWKNIAWVDNHLMAMKSKEIARAYYGKAHNSSFLLGCSSGGRQAYQTAQQFPADYNGIFVMTPSLYGSQYYPSTGYATIVSNIDLPDQPFSGTQLEMLSQKAIAHADQAITGHHDGYITDWLNSDYDPTKDLTVLRVEDGGNCTASWAVSMAQARALNKIWYGVTADGSVPDPAVDNGSRLNRTKSQLYWGRPRGSRLRYVLSPSFVPGIFLPVALLNTTLGDPTYIANGTNAWEQASYQEFAKYLVESRKADLDVMRMDADDTDLRPFQNLGGKILVTHGLADQVSPPHHSAAYYEDSAAITGGMETTADFHRLFFIPGMQHCSPISNEAGTANIPFPQPEQFLEKLVSWVEDDTPPDDVMAHSDDNLVSRPICPYPAMPKYNGHGDIKSGSSYAC